MTQKTITTSKAISKVKTVMGIAVAVMICIFFCCIYLLTLKVHFVWVGFILIMSVVLFKIFQLLYVLKWKIWAFQNVDDIAELLARSMSENITGDLFPRKWTFGLAKDKAKLTQIILYRYKHDYKREFDRNSIPPSMNITGSKLGNFIGFVCCAGVMYLPLKRVITNTSDYPENDYVMIIILSLIAVHFLLKTFEPNPKITMSHHGLWTKKSGFQKWDAIWDIHFSNKSEIADSGSFLVIEFRNKPNALISQRFDIRNLSKSADEIEKALKVYRKK